MLASFWLSGSSAPGRPGCRLLLQMRRSTSCLRNDSGSAVSFPLVHEVPKLDMTCSMMVVYQQVGMYKMMEASTYEASVYSVVASLGMVLTWVASRVYRGFVHRLSEFCSRSVLTHARKLGRLFRIIPNSTSCKTILEASLSLVPLRIACTY